MRRRLRRFRELKVELAGVRDGDGAEDTLAAFWSEIRDLLGSEDALADPVSYVLWVDWYEDRDTVEEAWRRTADTARLGTRGIERLLECSGPVPYGLKRQLFSRLSDERWHPWILASIVYSCTDVYGASMRLQR